MKWNPLPVDGAGVVEMEPRRDGRGFFVRAYCQREFAALGLETNWVNVNQSLSVSAGTLRGLHLQASPHEEVKLVRCLRGRLWDVVADVRPGSPTYLKWAAVEMGAEDLRWVYVPAGCAHGFLTLDDNSEAFYMVSAFYAPEAERGVRWDDPALAIDWPAEPKVISPKDTSWPLLLR